MSDEELIEKIARVLDSHVLGNANGGTASWAWVTCSCEHHIRVARTTREYVAALGVRHQAEEVLRVFREHTAPTDDDLPRCGYCGDGPDLPSCPAHGTYGYLKSDNSDESGIRRGAPAEPAVTDEMVERAASAMWDRWGHPGMFPHAPVHRQNSFRTDARAALEAALSTERGE